MGPVGAIIMSFFGSAFGTMALGARFGWTNPMLVVPAIVFVLICARGVSLTRRPGLEQRSERASRAMLWSSVGEGIGIFIVVNVLANSGHLSMLLPGIALVVGLHFFPMAYAIPFRSFYAIGGTLMATSILGFVLSQPFGTEVTGVCAAVILWTASVFALRRRRGASPRTKHGSSNAPKVARRY